MSFIAYHRQAVNYPHAQPVGLLIRGTRPDLADFDANRVKLRRPHTGMRARRRDRAVRDAVRAHGVGDPRDKVIGTRVFWPCRFCEVRARRYLWPIYSWSTKLKVSFLLGGARALE